MEKPALPKDISFPLTSGDGNIYSHDGSREFFGVYKRGSSYSNQQVARCVAHALNEIYGREALASLNKFFEG